MADIDVTVRRPDVQEFKSLREVQLWAQTHQNADDAMHNGLNSDLRTMKADSKRAMWIGFATFVTVAGEVLAQWLGLLHR